MDSPNVPFPTTAPDAKPQPLRILHYLPAIWLEQGGVVRAVLDWCEVFADRGHQVTLVVYDGRDMPEEWLRHVPGKPVAHVVKRPVPPLRLLHRASVRFIDTLLEKVDVIHLHGPWLNGNRQVANLARRRGIPYLVSSHGMLGDWSMSQGATWTKRLYMSLFGRRMLNAAAGVHCTAAEELAQTRKWFDGPPAVVLPCLLDLRPYRNLPGPDLGTGLIPPQHRDTPRLLFLGRINQQKGIDILVRAAALMRDAGTPFVLLVAGTGSPGYLKIIHDLVEQLRLGSRVVFLGQINGVEKLSLYQAADLFVHPTRHDNFGIVLIEALACGAAVLTTRGTDIWRDVHTAGGQVADCTPVALAAAAATLLADPADRTARGARGRQWVINTFAEDTLAGRYEAVYRQTVQNGK